MKHLRISVVMPSFNQAAFLAGAIDSVLGQQWPDLELFVIDGGSTDGSRAILEKYSRRLTGWVSEPDRGQAHAINKGLARCSGDILCWLNSDDAFEPGALEAVGLRFTQGDALAVAGHCRRIEVASGHERVLRARAQDHRTLLRYWEPYALHQPSVFWRREAGESAGKLDESLHLALDYEYWLRMARHCRFEVLDRILSRTNWHAQAKTGNGYDDYLRERRRVAWREARATGGARAFLGDFLRGALPHEMDAFLKPLVPQRWQGLRRRLRGERA